MFQRIAIVSLLCFFAVVPAAVGAGVDPNTVLISRDGVQVTRADLEHYVRVTIPEERRAQVLNRPGSVRDLIGQLYTIRAAAHQAEIALDADSEEIRWEVDYQRDRALMRALIRKEIEEMSQRAEWDELAHEHYNANLDEYRTPERVRASHVLIGLDDRSESEALALAEQIKTRAMDGEDFSALALEYSDDPSAERNEGNLGRFARGQMVPEFEKAAFALQKPGEIAGPVKTEFGYHVIKLHDRQDPTQRSFDAVKDSIIRELKNRQVRDTREAIIRRARSGDDIVVNDDAVERLEEELRVELPARPGERGTHRPPRDTE